MLARIRRSVDEKDSGFTLIELLVVMIIIGILAAIAIPVFLSQRAKARDTAVKADVSTLGKEIATYYVDNTAAPSAIRMVDSQGNLCTAATCATGARYQVNGTDSGKASDGVLIVTTVGNNATVGGYTAPQTNWSSGAWCVALTNTNGSTKTFKYSAQNGLETGQCSSASAP